MAGGPDAHFALRGFSEGLRLVVAFLNSCFASRFGISGPAGAGLGVLVWIFPAAILPGSVVREDVPLALASIHAGDWLVKLIVVAAIVGIWRQPSPRGLFTLMHRRNVLANFSR